LIETNLDKEIQDWVKKKIILKGNSGELIVQILDESIIDNFVEEHGRKFFGGKILIMFSLAPTLSNPLFLNFSIKK